MADVFLKSVIEKLCFCYGFVCTVSLNAKINCVFKQEVDILLQPEMCTVHESIPSKMSTDLTVTLKSEQIITIFLCISC